MLTHSFSILVVDDDKDVRDIVATLLADAGFQVACVGDGPAALNLLLSRAIDVLVTDIRLTPNMDGIELLKCARLQHPNLKCLFISGCHEPTVEDPALDDFVSKPFYVHEFLGCVWELLLRRIPGLIVPDVGKAKHAIGHRRNRVSKSSFRPLEHRVKRRRVRLRPLGRGRLPGASMSKQPLGI
jgi:CheY-like chemotaxis protein